jgi:hypothetical protein
VSHPCEGCGRIAGGLGCIECFKLKIKLAALREWMNDHLGSVRGSDWDMARHAILDKMKELGLGDDK